MNFSAVFDSVRTTYRNVWLVFALGAAHGACAQNQGSPAMNSESSSSTIATTTAGQSVDSTTDGTSAEDTQTQVSTSSGGVDSLTTATPTTSTTETSHEPVTDETNNSTTSDDSVSTTSDTGSSGSADVSVDPTACVTFVMPDDCTIPEGAVLPGELRCTGMYADWDSRTLYCGVKEYTPAYPLWSDGLEKRRYVWLPPNTSVDVTAPDDFQYPVGTQFWKEFGFKREDGSVQLAETRLMRRVQNGWMYTTYVWAEDGSNALQQNDGVLDWNGTGHTVPSRNQCKECHSGRPDFVLGWDAVMLGPGAAGLTREQLVAEGVLTWDGKDTGEPNPLDVAIPGDAVEQAALGYLHANCGVSCHNKTPDSLALETGFFTRLDVDKLASVQATDTFATGLHQVPLPNAPLSDLPAPPGGGTYVNLRPLDVERSLVLVRMKLRNVEAAMPRLGTNLVDDEGVAAVQAWIESMTEERGYPAPLE